MFKTISKIIIVLIIVFFIFSENTFGACSFNGDINSSMDGCLNGTSLVKPPNGNLLITDGLKEKINNWTMNIAVFLSLFAVGAIVFGSFRMVISGGEEEGIKKGKEIIKWSILGFLGIVSASGLVKLITEIIYSLAG